MAFKYLALNYLTVFACLLTCVTQTAAAENMDNFKSSFLQATKIQEGHVSLVEGPDSCQLGRIKVLKIEDDKTLTLMLGAEALVMDIGSSKHEESERKCKTQETVNFTSSHILSRRTEICGKRNTEYNVDVQLAVQGLEYVRDVISNGKVILHEECKYTYGD